ncbi:MAG: tRNA threonylcarbamoyladenosine dehydratase [Candidatus Cloacimonetes bacterium]|nr:tRNA threonylcarbamoyladenosine dehydratase [Candidatus Cloacimonadota bacterium]
MIFKRTEMLFGKENIEKFGETKIAVFGLGGVGSYACESLARSGFKKFILVDFDVVDLTNINRQNIALHSTIGRFKTEVMSERILDINPEAEIEIFTEFADLETRKRMLSDDVDFVVDAIDSLNPKVGLLEDVYHLGIPVISSMGAGNRIDPSKIMINDLSKTFNCQLAYRVRKYLRRRGITTGIDCVFSSEPANDLFNDDSESNKDEKSVIRGREREPIGSVSYLTAIMGLWTASFVIRRISGRL